MGAEELLRRLLIYLAARYGEKIVEQWVQGAENQQGATTEDPEWDCLGEPFPEELQRCRP